jgi:NMD protein affecting ribosome stability and mRNA decay
MEGQCIFCGEQAEVTITVIDTNFDMCRECLMSYNRTNDVQPEPQPIMCYTRPSYRPRTQRGGVR